jgi:hypothetical protein
VTTKVIMAAIIDQAARKFNADEADGVNRRHRAGYRFARPSCFSIRERSVASFLRSSGVASAPKSFISNKGRVMSRIPLERFP